MAEKIDCRGMVRNLVLDLLKHPMEAAKRSYLDCHARGVHSIYLAPVGGQNGMIRMFYATPIHDIACNKDLFDGKDTPLSVGVHPHRRDLILSGLFGTFTNHNLHLNGAGKVELTRFHYRSAIKDGECSFKAAGVPLKFTSRSEQVQPGYAVRLAARDLHTVSVEAGKEAIWLVAEGAEDKNYQSVCYSNSDLTKFNPNGMYKVPSVPIFCAILRGAAKRLTETPGTDR